MLYGKGVDTMGWYTVIYFIKCLAVFYATLCMYCLNFVLKWEECSTKYILPYTKNYDIFMNNCFHSKIDIYHIFCTFDIHSHTMVLIRALWKLFSEVNMNQPRKLPSFEVLRKLFLRAGSSGRQPQIRWSTTAKLIINHISFFSWANVMTF